jgi:hypothetical protein
MKDASSGACRGEPSRAVNRLAAPGCLSSRGVRRLSLSAARINDFRTGGGRVQLFTIVFRAGPARTTPCRHGPSRLVSLASLRDHGVALLVDIRSARGWSPQARHRGCRRRRPTREASAGLVPRRRCATIRRRRSIARRPSDLCEPVAPPRGVRPRAQRAARAAAAHGLACRRLRWARDRGRCCTGHLPSLRAPDGSSARASSTRWSARCSASHPELLSPRSTARSTSGFSMPRISTRSSPRCPSDTALSGV